jgi:CRISPR-associated exonuclease Cas4
MTIRPPDYLPISMLNQLEYCERRFWLMYVHAEMEINAPVLEGIQRHERAHTSGAERDGDTTVRRRVYLWSDQLRVAGFADVVEERAGELVPVEYKRGRMGRWLNDHVQLCAQAMCLEERTGRPVERGEIFYWRSRRRVAVAFTPELRARTEASVARAFELLAAGQMPPPAERRAKCHDCSLEGICLPREVLLLSKEPG